LDVSDLGLSAGGISVYSNAVSGGAVHEWWWNNTQFINNWGWGHLMQADVQFQSNVNPSIGLNPTEAGDIYTGYERLPEDRHGSPIVNIQNSGNTQLTRAVPLEFLGTPGTADFYGAGPDNPVVYKDMLIGKDLTLNYNNMGAVAEYETYVYSSAQIGAAQRMQMEIPIAHLTQDKFTNYYTYDVANNELRQYKLGCAATQDPHFDYTGVIAEDPVTGNAMGMYGAHRRVGGSVTSMHIGNFNCSPNPNPDHHYFTTRLGASCSSIIYTREYPCSLAVGENRFSVWIINGTVATIRQQMRQLWRNGDK
jgi:hypothetical protein